MLIDSFRKPRVPNIYHRLHYLQGRTNLPQDVVRQFERLQRGYIGEKKFYKKMCTLLPGNSLILYSLNLTYRDASFQLDSLLFLGGKVVVFEIKYFSGDYVVQGADWFVANTNQSINNPLRQLERSQVFLRQVVQEYGFSGQVDGRVVFMHEHFYLYGARVENPIIFLPQIEREISRLVKNTRTAGPGERRLAKSLVKHHVPENRYEQMPTYQYEELWKGLNCPSCCGMMERQSQRSFICSSCSSAYNHTEVLLFNIKQFITLFPERKLTVRAISDWCGGAIGEHSIRNILSKNYKVVKNGRGTVYQSRD